MIIGNYSSTSYESADPTSSIGEGGRESGSRATAQQTYDIYIDGYQTEGNLTWDQMVESREASIVLLNEDRERLQVVPLGVQPKQRPKWVVTGRGPALGDLTSQQAAQEIAIRNNWKHSDEKVEKISQAVYDINQKAAEASAGNAES